jgi:hypothetical protein
MYEKNIMSYESTLPENFDGVFRFTNWTDEDFVAKWGSKEYRFPAKTTSPIFIPNQTPLEIQQIRKKFALDLAQKVFGSTELYNRLIAQERNPDGSARLNSIQQAGSYSLNDLAPYIQRCLEPLPAAKAEVTDAPIEPIENKLTRNEDGELNTEAIDKKTSLRERALKGKRE